MSMEILNRVTARYGDISHGDIMPDDRYALVERSRIDPSAHYVTTHPTKEAAAGHYAGQEEPQDWTVVLLVDLVTGERFDGEIKYDVAWSPMPAGALCQHFSTNVEGCKEGAHDQ